MHRAVHPNRYRGLAPSPHPLAMFWSGATPTTPDAADLSPPVSRRILIARTYTLLGVGLRGMGEAVLQQLARPEPTRPRQGGALLPLLVAGGALYLLALAAMQVGPHSPDWFVARGELIATIFLGVFIEALPFLLIGTLASGAIQVFVAPDLLQRFSPRSPVLVALVGATMGLCFLPVCECGTVPATRRLLTKGAPPPLGIAFLLAAPAVNPVVIVTTAIAFRDRPLIVVGRVALTVLIAATVGVLVGRRAGADVLPPPDGAHTHETGGNRWFALLRHTGAEFFEMTRFLTLGAAIAATFQVVVPQQTLLGLGQGAIVSVLVLMALATILSICSTVDAFVALAFAGSFLPGALLAFLVFGPMIDLKSVLLFGTTFRRRTVAALVVLTTLLVGGVAIGINLLLVR